MEGPPRDSSAAYGTRSWGYRAGARLVGLMLVLGVGLAAVLLRPSRAV
ncbi:hypothetical protein [Nonomuraea sp. B19D2]